jgi:hypothetical protein
MTAELNKALGLEDPARLAIYTHIAALTAPIAEAAVDCLFSKAAAQNANEKEMLASVRRKMIRLYAGVTAQLALVLNDVASLKREIATTAEAEAEANEI